MVLSHTAATFYEEGDKQGQFLAYISFLPFLAVLFMASAAYSRREVHLFFVVLGFVCCEALARTLKHTFQQPRPFDACGHLGACSPGLPSSHTQLMVCAAAIRAGLLLRFLEQKSVVSILMGLMELVLCVVSAACVAWSRVYLGYHTTDQVLCAAVLGGLFGLAWVWMMSKLNSLFSYLARSSLGQLLNVKNTWGIADTLYLEALAHRQIRGGAAVRSKKQT